MKQEYTMESSLSLDETNSSIDISEDHSLKIPDSSSLVSNVLLDTLDSQDTEHASNTSPFKMNSHRDLVEDDRFLSNEEGDEDYENTRFENDSNQYHSPSSTNNHEQLSEQQQFSGQDFDKEEELSQDDFEEEEELSEVEDDDGEFDDRMMMTTDNSLDSYEEYEKDQDQFNREMNRTKIAFAAYRNAVLHLIHNQNYKQKHSTEEKDESHNVNDDERISKLEELAKAMVETKAKACVDAVLVANEFVERRAARMQRSKMLTETIDGNVNLFAELLKRSQKEKVGVDESRKISCNGFKFKYSRRRMMGRHADCILSTLPKFEFRRDEDDISTDVEEGHSPARYKTSIWIGNMVEWRKQRNEYKESCYRKCSCPDCQNDLKNLLKIDKNC
jgi:hypothetical protein